MATDSVAIVQELALVTKTFLSKVRSGCSFHELTGDITDAGLDFLSTK
jgi:hypothetical protein